jgi:hypothetical protein
MKQIILIAISAFCFLHILRDYMQVKYGYSHSWFTSVGHVWHAPQYEKQGMVVFFALGMGFLYLALRSVA